MFSSLGEIRLWRTPDAGRLGASIPSLWRSGKSNESLPSAITKRVRTLVGAITAFGEFFIAMAVRLRDHEKMIREHDMLLACARSRLGRQHFARIEKALRQGIDWEVFWPLARAHGV